MLSYIITEINERILKYLVGHSASLTEIATATNTTKANISRSLNVLEREDLVRKEIRGKTHIYRFNYYHTFGQSIMRLLLEDKKRNYDLKLHGKPSLLNRILKQMLKDNYLGCLFFGSSLETNFKDIDVFILLKKTDKSNMLIERIKKIDARFSPLFGTLQEINQGIGHEDMLFKNIIKGLPYTCEEEIIYLKYKHYFLRKKDIEERFIIGYREILSCFEFDEKEYVRMHLEKGIMGIIYAAVNYKEFEPKNDKEAKMMFKQLYKMDIPAALDKGLLFAEKMSGLIL